MRMIMMRMMMTMQRKLEHVKWKKKYVMHVIIAHACDLLYVKERRRIHHPFLSQRSLTSQPRCALPAQLVRQHRVTACSRGIASGPTT